jgi:hypothetical protein
MALAAPVANLAIGARQTVFGYRSGHKTSATDLPLAENIKMEEFR